MGLDLENGIEYLRAMKSQEVLPSREALRADLAEKLDQLDTENLAVVHHVLLEIEKERLWKDFSTGMAEDWAAGKYDRLDEIIREARAALRQRM
jgi:hypothetical protein